MSRIAERIKNSSLLIRNRSWYGIHIACRKTQVFSKATVACDTDTDIATTKMRTTSTTIAAMSARNMPLARNSIANFKKIRHFFAYFYNFSNKFMTNDQRYMNMLLRPIIPIVNMNIGATNSGFFDFNQNIIWANHWDRNFL